MEYVSVTQWIIVLFAFSLAIGIISPISGVGGGVMFVPLATAFFPFSIDFIRGTGLIIALTSSLFSTPHFLRRGLTNIRIITPPLVFSNLTAIAGGMSGLWITNTLPSGEASFKIALGVVLLFIFLTMLFSKKVEYPRIKKVDNLSKRLELRGAWYEPSLNRVVEFETTNLVAGILCFGGVGFMAGMFGLGAGWASVPVLNLIMGAPIKVAAASSMAIIAINASAASWVYMARGAILPLICIPSVVGVSIGAIIGARLAEKSKPAIVKYMVMGIMIFTAVTNISNGLKGLKVF